MTEKVFINNSGMATFVCPKCQKTKITNVARYQKTEKAVKVNCRCSCGHQYSVLLERRKFYRRTTDLPGSYLHKKTELPGTYKIPWTEDKGRMTVTDISRSGLKLKLNVERDFKPGDKLFVEFNLDNQDHSLIEKHVIVRNVRGCSVGVEFVTIEPFGQLGAYLIK